jgi:hypothetical protein
MVTQNPFEANREVEEISEHRGCRKALFAQVKHGEMYLQLKEFLDSVSPDDFKAT